MSQLGTKQPKYKDGMTKQSFKDETDINKLLKRAQKSGTISHLNKYQGRYGDFANFDFFEAQTKMAKGREIFDALPPEIRSEFSQSPAGFFDYVNDPANVDRLGELLPALAAPGRQHIPIKGNLSADDEVAFEELKKVDEKPALEEPKKEPVAAPKAPEAPSTDNT